MRSKNQEVDPLFAPFITNVFLIHRIFRVLRNSLFQNKRPLLKKQNGASSLQGKNLLRFPCVHSVLRTLPALPERLSLKAVPEAPVNFHPSFKYSWFAIRFLHAILFLLTGYDALLHHIDYQLIIREKSISCILLKIWSIYFPHDTFMSSFALIGYGIVFSITDCRANKIFASEQAIRAAIHAVLRPLLHCS